MLLNCEIFASLRYYMGGEQGMSLGKGGGGGGGLYGGRRRQKGFTKGSPIMFKN